MLLMLVKKVLLPDLLIILVIQILKCKNGMLTMNQESGCLLKDQLKLVKKLLMIIILNGSKMQNLKNVIVALKSVVVLLVKELMLMLIQMMNQLMNQFLNKSQSLCRNLSRQQQELTVHPWDIFLLTLNLKILIQCWVVVY